MSDKKEEPTEGNLFSHNYHRPAQRISESERFRRRIAIKIHQVHPNLHDATNAELGLGLSYDKIHRQSRWENHSIDLDLKDLLDLITLTFRQLKMEDHRKRRQSFNVSENSDFIEDISRIFEEEYVHFRLDQEGGVHYFIDAEFEQARHAAIQTLSAKRYVNVRDEVEHAYRLLRDPVSNPSDAIHKIFKANEVLFKLIFTGTQNLGTKTIRNHLNPKIDQKYSDDKTSKSASSKLSTQYAAWVEGAHFYRHGQASEAVESVPEEIMHQYMTAGTAWLRWLQTFDDEAGTSPS